MNDVADVFIAYDQSVSSRRSNVLLLVEERGAQERR